MLRFSRFLCFTCFLFFTEQCSVIHKVKIPQSKSTFVSNFKLLNNLPNKHVELFDEYSLLDVIVADNLDTEQKNGIIRLYANNSPVVLHSAREVLSTFSTHHHFKTRCVIGIYSHTTDVDLNMWIHYFNNRWNPRSKIIVWIMHQSSTSSVENLFRRFWNQECMNVVIIIHDKKTAGYKLYSYDPFFLGDSKKRGRMYTLSEDDDFFTNKMKNLYGYEIKISLYHRPPYSVLSDNNLLVDGTEVEILKAMAFKYNFTPILITSKEDANDYVVHLRNGTEEGPIGDLIIKKSEMLGNTFYINLVIEKQVEFITPFYLADYIAVVPKNMGVKLIVRFYHHLKNPFYIMTFASLGFLAIYLYFKKEKNYILTSWYLLMYQHFRKFDNNYCDKCTRLTWILWATIISSLYQGAVYEYLSTPNPESDINTLRELYDSELELKVGEAMLIPLKSSEEDYKRKIGERASSILKLHDCYKEFQKYQNISCAADKTFGMYYFRELLSKDRSAHIVKEPLSKFWVTYIVKDGFPFKKLLHFTVFQFYENGLFVKWGKDSWRKYGLLAAAPIHEKGPLPLSYFKITFFGLYFGLIAATLTFFVEIIITCIKRKNCTIKILKILKRKKKIIRSRK